MKKAIYFMRIVFLVCLMIFLNKESYSQTPARTKAITTIQDSLPDNNTKAITPSRLRYTLFRMLDATKDSVPILDMINLQKNINNGLAGLDGAGKILVSQLPAETDPTVPAWVKAITQTDTSHWHQAYSWGNHATAGYLVPIITSPVEGQVLKYISGAWRNSSASSSPDSTTASNGLNMAGKEVRLGGALNIETLVGDGTQRLNFNIARSLYQVVDTLVLRSAATGSQIGLYPNQIIASGNFNVQDNLYVANKPDFSVAAQSMRVPVMTGDPGSGNANGDVIYNSTLNRLRVFEEGSWKSLYTPSDAGADGVTKGIAAFTASDFNAASGVISLDYTNMQVGSGSQNGIITPTLYNLFNPTFSNGITRTGNNVTGGGALTGPFTLTGTTNSHLFNLTGRTSSFTALMNITVKDFNPGESSWGVIIKDSSLGGGIALHATSINGEGIYGVGRDAGVVGTFSGTGGNNVAVEGRTPGSLGSSVFPAIRAVNNGENSLTNQVVPSIDLVANAGGGGLTTGYGVKLRTFLPRFTGGFFWSGNLANTIESRITNISGANYTVDQVFTGVKDSVYADQVTFKGGGAVKFHKYGINTFAGTPTYALGVDADGDLVEFAVSSGGGLTGANEGLSVSGTNAQLGGTITGVTTITGTGSGRVVINAPGGVGPVAALTVSSTANFSAAIRGTTTDGAIAILGENSDNSGVGVSGAGGSSGVGVSGGGISGAFAYVGVSGTITDTLSTSLQAYMLGNQSGSGDNIMNGLVFRRLVGSPATPTNGMGSSITWRSPSYDAGDGFSFERDFGKLEHVYVDYNGPNQQTEFRLYAVGDSVENRIMTMNGLGPISLNKYGTGAITGTAAYNLAVDASGNVIEVATGGGATGANPTASVGLTAVNGSAGTFMRSDAAPPLDQAIAPVWTGAHTFTSAATGTVPGFGIKNAAPYIDIWNTAVANSDQRRWGLTIGGSGGPFQLRAINDDGSVPSSGIAMQVFRNGGSVQDVQLFVVSGTPRIKIESSQITVATLTGTGTRTVTATSAGVLGAGPVLTSGTWTPTLTGVANVDGTPTLLHSTYHQIGSVVYCQLTLSVDPTATATQTEVGVSLPVASNFTGSNDASGQGAGSTGNGKAVYVQAISDSTNDRATVIFESASTSASIITVSFQYNVL